MPRHDIPELSVPQEVPLVVYNAGRRVIVGRAVVLANGIAAYFDGDLSDTYISSIVRAITKGAVNGLSIAPTPPKDLVETERSKSDDHTDRLPAGGGAAAGR